MKRPRHLLQIPLRIPLPGLLLGLLTVVWLAGAAHGIVLKPAQTAGAVEEGVPKPVVVFVPIQGPLTEEMVALVVRGIRHARELEAKALIFEIDCEGGDILLMDRMIDEIERAEGLETVAYVTQKAMSAGSLIAISCGSVYMRPGASMGSSLLLMVPQIFGLPAGKIETLRDDNAAYFRKIINSCRAHWRAKAQDHGRPDALAEAMVYADKAVIEVEIDGERQFLREPELVELAKVRDESEIRRIRTVVEAEDVLCMTAQEWYEVRMVDGLVTSRDDLLQRLALHHAATHEVAPSWSEKLAGFLQSFGVVLLIAGLIAVFVEIKVPGFGLPGVIGTVCLGLWMFGKYLAGLAEITELLLVVAGFGLIAVEIFVLPGMLVSGITGVVSLLAGLVLSAQQSVLPDPTRPLASEAWWATANSTALAVAGSVVGMIAMAHVLPRIPVLNRAILKPVGAAGAAADASILRPIDEIAPNWRPAVGARGAALTPLRPSGKVLIDGHELDAVSEGSLIERGAAVTVAMVEPGRLVVRAAGAPS
jgi:membrane-bound serine protease (ClpP class)